MASRSQVTDLLAAARVSSNLAAFRALALERLAHVVPYESGLFFTLGADATTVGKTPEYVERFRQGARRYLPDMRKGIIAARSQGGVFLDTEVYTARERDRLPFFVEIVRPQRISCQLTAHLYFREQAVGALHLCRHGGEFSASEIRRLQELVPALTLAHGALALAERTFPATPLADGDPPTEALELLARLTRRETQVAAQVARGLSTKEIAQTLLTSPMTVRNQLSRIFQKTGATSRAQLAAWVSDARGVQLPRGGE